MSLVPVHAGIRRRPKSAAMAGIMFPAMKASETRGSPLLGPITTFSLPCLIILKTIKSGLYFIRMDCPIQFAVRENNCHHTQDENDQRKVSCHYVCWIRRNFMNLRLRIYVYILTANRRGWQRPSSSFVRFSNAGNYP